MNKNLNSLINEPYKYGFSTKIDKETINKGLNENIIRLLSQKKEEPEFMLNFRLKAFKIWKQFTVPNWAQLKVPEIEYQDIVYYSAPKLKEKIKSLDEVDPEILKTFEKLGISLTEQKRLTNVAVDAVFDSVSVGTTYQTELKEQGVIFCSLSEAVKDYPNLIEKFLKSLVSILFLS